MSSENSATETNDDRRTSIASIISNQKIVSDPSSTANTAANNILKDPNPLSSINSITKPLANTNSSGAFSRLKNSNPSSNLNYYSYSNQIYSTPQTLNNYSQTAYNYPNNGNNTAPANTPALPHFNNNYFNTTESHISKIINATDNNSNTESSLPVVHDKSPAVAAYSAYNNQYSNPEFLNDPKQPKSNKRKLGEMNKPVINSTERPFACLHTGCAWAFARQSDLRRHSKSHAEPAFHCPYWRNDPTCHRNGGAFNRLDVLKRHLKLVHYVQDKTNQSFNDKNDPGWCRACQKMFANSREFVDHCLECAQNLTPTEWKNSNQNVTHTPTAAQDEESPSDKSSKFINLNNNQYEASYNSYPEGNILNPRPQLPPVSLIKDDDIDTALVSINPEGGDEKRKDGNERKRSSRGRPKKIHS